MRAGYLAMEVEDDGSFTPRFVQWDTTPKGNRRQGNPRIRYSYGHGRRSRLLTSIWRHYRPSLRPGSRWGMRLQGRRGCIKFGRQSCLALHPSGLMLRRSPWTTSRAWVRVVKRRWGRLRRALLKTRPMDMEVMVKGWGVLCREPLRMHLLVHRRLDALQDVAKTEAGHGPGHRITMARARGFGKWPLATRPVQRTGRHDGRWVMWERLWQRPTAAGPLRRSQSHTLVGDQTRGQKW